jgi:hypothetical protein
MTTGQSLLVTFFLIFMGVPALDYCLIWWWRTFRERYKPKEPKEPRDVA